MYVYSSISYRELPRVVKIDVSVGTCGHEEASELAGSDADQSPQDERSVPVAYDAEVPPNPEVFFQNRFDIGVDLEHLREIIKAEDLEAADEAEQNAYQEKHQCSVKPGAELQGASNCIAEDDVSQEGDASSA